jgi:hypothetical protein
LLPTFPNLSDGLGKAMSPGGVLDFLYFKNESRMLLVLLKKFTSQRGRQHFVV